jgi:hypothetical protein
MKDWSVKVSEDQDEWKKKCSINIKKCDLVIVMVGENTSTCDGVNAEIKIAKEFSIPVVGVKGYQSRTCPEPEGLEGYYKWTWENIRDLVSGER